MTWTILIIFILLLLGFDLIVLHKKGEVTNRRTAIETCFWVLIALSFSAVVYWIYLNGWVANEDQLNPGEAVTDYITGYLIELSLSVDNLFVIAMIFASFNIPLKYQHTTLFWGILGAIFFRGLMIGLGVMLITKISWMTYIFGGLLLFTAFKMLVKEEEENTERKPPPFLSKLIPMTDQLTEERFFVLENGIRKATPLFSALILIEVTDVLFALDSIPAILAVTTDPFIVFSSNIFAILGLRSMYFFLANMLEKFKYLKYSNGVQK